MNFNICNLHDVVFEDCELDNIEFQSCFFYEVKFINCIFKDKVLYNERQLSNSIYSTLDKRVDKIDFVF